MGDSSDELRAAASAKLNLFMQREMEEVLAELEGDQPKIDYGYEPPSPDVTTPAATEVDVTADPLNDHRVGDVDARYVKVTPTPVAMDAGPVVNSMSTYHVPRTRARFAADLSSRQAVSNNVSSVDASFTQHLGLSRSANASARRTGNLAASVAYTLGEDGTRNTEASCLSIASRVASALMAARQGAVAHALPVSGKFDIAHCTLDEVGDAEARYPDHLPVYLPSDMAPGMMSALVSLLVVGGPGAYEWGFFEDGDARADWMPSVMRFQHPGGTNSILVVTERDVELPAMGGASLTVVNLSALERYWRRFWGNSVWDTAWRTAVASAAVYLVPSVDKSGVITPGDNFEIRRGSVTVDGTNLRGRNFDTWHGIQEGFDDDGGGVLADRYFDLSNRSVQHQRDEVFWRLTQVIRPRDDYRDVGRHIAYGGDTVVVRWQLDGDNPDNPEFAEEQWDYVEVDDDHYHDFTHRERLLVRAVSCSKLGMGIDALIGRRDPIADNYQPRLNVWGAHDIAQIGLPGLRINEVLGLCAKFTRPVNFSGTSHNDVVDDAYGGRVKLYAAHLHLACMHAYARADLWPADLMLRPREHSSYIRMLAPSMRPWSWLGQLSDREYDQANWWVLEDRGMVRGCHNATPFAGYLVRGAWDADSRAIVRLDSKTTSYPAVEAAVRAALDDGGVIAAVGRFGARRFAAIRGPSGLVNALPVAPRIATQRGLDGVELAADRGLATLQTGACLVGPNYYTA